MTRDFTGGSTDVPVLGPVLRPLVSLGLHGVTVTMKTVLTSVCRAVLGSEAPWSCSEVPFF